MEPAKPIWTHGAQQSISTHHVEQISIYRLDKYPKDEGLLFPKQSEHKMLADLTATQTQVWLTHNKQKRARYWRVNSLIVLSVHDKMTPPKNLTKVHES